MNNFWVNQKIYLWLPDLFESKGGIQTYLQAFIRATMQDFPRFYFAVFNKLDTKNNLKGFDSEQVLFFTSGHVPNIIRTYHFAFNLILGVIKGRPRVIICGHINFAPIAYWIYRITGISYWIIVYGIDVWDIENSIKRKALHSAEKIISISAYTRDRLVKEQNIPLKNFHVLPVTFDASQFQISSKPSYLLDRYNLSAAQPTIITVARLSQAEQYKGYDSILKTLPKIREIIPDVHYILVGKGDDLPRVEQLIAQLGLQTHVTLAGFVPANELSDHYNLANVFAMPSKGEGFGIVYLEALACGKPTIGGNQDGAIDALCQGELGVLVDPDDIDAIAQTLVQVLQRTYPHPILYKPEVLRQQVIERYGFERFRQILSGYINEFFVSNQ